MAGAVGLHPDVAETGSTCRRSGPEQEDRVGSTRTAACPQPGPRTCVPPAPSAVELEDSGHGIRAHRDRDPRRRTHRRGRPARRPGTADHPPGRRRRGRHDAHPAAAVSARRGGPAAGSGATRRRSPPVPAVELPPAEPEPGLVFETPPPSAGPAGPAALAAGPLAVLPRPRPAHRPRPREAHRGRLGGGRGDPARRRRRRRPRPPRSSSGCAPSRWCWPPPRGTTCGSCWSTS